MKKRKHAGSTYFAMSAVALVAAFAAPAITSAAEGDVASPSLAVVLTPSFTSVRTGDPLPQEQGFSEDRKLGWGGGLLYDSPIAEGISLGVGALYIQRKFQIGTGSVRFERKVPTVFVPVEAKVWLGNVFSIGGGVFGAVKAGNVTDSIVTGSGTLNATSDPGRNTFDYGLTASANFLLPVAERTGVLLGARYLYGLSDGTKSAAYDEKIDDFALQAGLSFTL
jgi:hypothetical protein